MTPRTLKTALDDRTVTVQKGCENPLRHHFMVIETFIEDDEPLYGNPHDDCAVLADWLAHFAKQARAFGIVLLPEALAKPRAQAALNLGNARSTCEVAGVETQV